MLFWGKKDESKDRSAVDYYENVLRELIYERCYDGEHETFDWQLYLKEKDACGLHIPEVAVFNQKLLANVGDSIKLFYVDQLRFEAMHWNDSSASRIMSMLAQRQQDIINLNGFFPDNSRPDVSEFVDSILAMRWGNIPCDRATISRIL